MGIEFQKENRNLQIISENGITIEKLVKKLFSFLLSIFSSGKCGKQVVLSSLPKISQFLYRNTKENSLLRSSFLVIV